jgi:hypothetical protein
MVNLSPFLLNLGYFLQIMCYNSLQRSPRFSDMEVFSFSARPLEVMVLGVSK